MPAAADPPVRSSVRRLMRPSQLPVSPMRPTLPPARARAYARAGWSALPEQLARRDRAPLERELRERRALAVLRHVGEPEQLEQRVEVELDRLDAEAQLGRQLAVRRRRGEARVRRAGGRAPPGRGAARRSAAAASGSRPTAVLRSPPAIGETYVSIVRPIARTSPWRSGRRPCTRSPLTNDPLRERPSSTSVQTSPMHSMSACARETSSSQVSATALAAWRPIVSGERSAVSSTIRCARRRRGARGTAFPAARPPGAP